MPDHRTSDHARQDGGRTGRSLASVTERIPRGLVIRLVVYLVVGHVFAGFLWLLFALGAESQ
ncbi:DUF6126 family protein [Streptomyces sp. HNM0574]|uniref:DUF6126 family protein n=1 Tax=Streptomyces sp. HNM0574 TaxID=2714954 RepID=UPI0019D1AE98|nr:DUF6126 family protein [Streptomyces sp. HNM0574]